MLASMWYLLYCICLCIILSSAAPTGKSPSAKNIQEKYSRLWQRKQTVELNGKTFRRLGDDISDSSMLLELEAAEFNYGVNEADVVEGDIRIPHEYLERDAMDGTNRKVGSDKFYTRWADKKIPWRIRHGEYADADVSFILETVREAIAVWESKSCVRFPEQTVEDRYIEIVNGSGCSSYIGNPYPVQTMSLKMTSRDKLSCMIPGIVMHEFGHAAAFKHEHVRPDRNQYSKMQYGNITPGKEHNFVKMAYGVGEDYSNAPYDASSVMHYSLTGFSYNGAKTISMLRPELDSLTGQRVTLSYYDEVAMNRAYDCAEECPEICENHGFVRRIDGECKCTCPPYLGGPTCTEVATPNCGSTYTLTSGQSITINNQKPGHKSKLASASNCAYMFKAPSSGHSLRVHIDEIDLPDCTKYLDIRNNVVGQPSPTRLCGTKSSADTNPLEDLSTGLAVDPDTLLVVYVAGDGTDPPSSSVGKYQFTVTAELDPCMGDPCHGVPCVSEGDTHSCLYPTHAIHCGFETGLAGACAALKPNVYFDDSAVGGRAWDIAAGGAAEGLYYWECETEGTGDLQIGTMSIIPIMIGGTVWCLDYKYTAYGNSNGQLNTYMMVNGEKGEVLRSRSGSLSTKVWYREQIILDGTTLSQTDMVEILFEAKTASPMDKGSVGVDDIRLSPGYCHPWSTPCDSYPCGTRTCTNLGGDNYQCEQISGEITCGFEQWDTQCQTLLDIYVSGDELNPIYNTGETPSSSTGPSSAHTGLAYLYLEATGTQDYDSAFIRFNPLTHTNKHLSFYYSAYGLRMGSMLLYRSINGEDPSVRNKIAEVFVGDKGDIWRYFEIDIDASDLSETDDFELIIEMITGSDYRSDMAIDDITLRDVNTAQHDAQMFSKMIIAPFPSR